MPTGQDIINNALRSISILEQGGTPSVSDSTDALDQLNAMWDAWSIDDGLIYAISAGRYALTAGQGIYTIGQPGDSGLLPNFNAPRPAKIFRASITSATGGAISVSSLYAGGAGYVALDTGLILSGNGAQATYRVDTVDVNGAVVTYTITSAGTGYQLTKDAQTVVGGATPGAGLGFRLSITTVTSGGQNRNNLRIVEAGQYFGHNDLSASGSTPDELYPDYLVNVEGFATLYLYPVPLVLGATDIELETGVPFSEWTLVDNYMIPAGYRDALQEALAYRLLSWFGAAVSQEIAANVTAKGIKAEERIRAMNANNRMIPMPAAPAMAAQ